jgi:hypothetical protein
MDRSKNELYWFQKYMFLIIKLYYTHLSYLYHMINYGIKKFADVFAIFYLIEVEYAFIINL